MIGALPTGINKVSYIEIERMKGVSFAHYFQPGSDKQCSYDIDWIPVKAENRAILLVSRFGLYCEPFSRDGNTSWKQSTLRKWLNDEWIEQSFNKYGNGCLVVPAPADDPLCIRSLLPYSKPNEEGLRVKEDSEDYVFLLDSREANELLEGCVGLAAHWVADETQLESEHAVKWWTRPNWGDKINCIDENGEETWYSPDADNVFVRPAIWLDNYYIQRSILDVTESWRELLTYAERGMFDYDKFKRTATETYKILHLYYNHANQIVAYPKAVVKIVILISMYSKIHMNPESNEHLLSMKAADSFCAQSIEWITIYKRDPASGHLDALQNAFVMNDLNEKGIVVDARTFDMERPLDTTELANEGCFTLLRT